MFLQIEAELSETVTYSSLNFAISDGVNTVTTRLLLVIFIYVVLSLFFLSIYNKLNIIISYRTPCAHIHKFIYIYIYICCVDAGRPPARTRRHYTISKAQALDWKKILVGYI